MPRIKGNITSDNGTIRSFSNGSFLFEPNKGSFLRSRHHLCTNVNKKVEIPFPSSSFYKCHGSKLFASVQKLNENNEIVFYSLNDEIVEEVGRYTLPISFDINDLQCVCADRFLLYCDRNSRDTHYFNLMTSESFNLGRIGTPVNDRSAPFFLDCK
ncbi:hypothetical protein PCE1_000375 [Barthelona sp. PCE]